ncbi:hypothetical protein BDV33DRAFT_211103 [Aspergillus novoparasiticus]|uniref:BTB domain-containing protein n=1 Tax=Aspergillus novoparasiticus TaxID=986946 RepID=A0A5N6E500_9EURO|nr:hypothetical protein BDV33DRAFT_211103 [Aspergillus novoparasiticus]
MESFQRPNGHYGNIEWEISLAIDGNHYWTANNLLEKTRFHLRGLGHDNRLLDQNLSTTSLWTPLSIACSRDHVEIVALIVGSLTKEDEETTAIQSHPKVKRSRILQQSVWVSIQTKSHSITAILLVPFESVAYFNAPSHILPTNKTLEKVTDGEYATISRQTCLTLLSSRISTETRQGISRCLRLKEQKDLRLPAEGQTFSAHRNVLSYWSPYFASLSKNQSADSEHIQFRQDMSAASVNTSTLFAPIENVCKL